MRRWMISVLMIGICVTFGAAVGAGGVGYFGLRQVNKNAAVQRASDASFEAEVLSRLRLGETAKAVALLEDDLNDNVSRIRDHVASLGEPANFPTPHFGDLMAGPRAYRIAFPSTEPYGRGIDAYLAQAPELYVSPGCTAGICRLPKPADTSR